MTITIGVQGFSSAAPSYAFITPTIPANGSKLLIWAGTAANNRTYTPSGGVTLLAVTPDTGTASQSGHQSFEWQATANTANTGQPITFTQGGGNLKTAFVWAVIDNPDATLPLNRTIAAVSTANTAHQTAASTTTSFGCVEIQVVFDSRGATSPNTSTWTRPGSMSAQADVFLTGSSAFTSASIGYNVSTLSSGTAIGGDTWTANASAIGSMWTIAIKTTAGTPELVYTRQRMEIFDCTASTGGTPTLTKVDGPAITITESPAMYFTVRMPDVLSSDLILDVGMTGTTTVRETISAEAIQALRKVYNGTDWE